MTKGELKKAISIILKYLKDDYLKQVNDPGVKELDDIEVLIPEWEFLPKEFKAVLESKDYLKFLGVLRKYIIENEKNEMFKEVILIDLNAFQ